MSKAQDALIDELDEMFKVHPEVSQGVRAVDMGSGETATLGDKSDWVEIWVDEVEGLPNYEVAQGNGVLYQIQRGVPSLVPPIVVEIFKLAIKSTYKMMPHPTIMGKEILHEIISSSIPWRKV